MPEFSRLQTLHLRDDFSEVLRLDLIMPEEETEFEAARRVNPSEAGASIADKLADMAVPMGAVGIAIGLVCLLNQSSSTMIVAASIVFGCGVIAEAIRENRGIGQ